MLHFFFSANPIKVLGDTVTRTQALHSVMGQQVVMRPLGSRENAHATGTKGL